MMLAAGVSAACIPVTRLQDGEVIREVSAGAADKLGAMLVGEIVNFRNPNVGLLLANRKRASAEI